MKIVMKLVLSLRHATAGASTTLKRLVVLMIIGGPRFKHFQKSRLIETRPEALVFHCERGKRRVLGTRPGFTWAAPRDIGVGFDPIGPLSDFFEEMREQRGGVEIYLCPNLKCQKKSIAHSRTRG